MKDIAIIGLGWLGLPLYRRLATQGWSLAGSVTQADKCLQLQADGVEAICWQADRSAAPWPRELKAGTLILNVPPSRNDDYAGLIASMCQQAAAAGIRQVLYVSSTAVYGGEGIKTEDEAPAPHERRGQVMLAAERAVECCDIPHKTILRPAGLIGPGRYPGRFLAGKSVVDGQQPVNLVHIDDCLAIISLLLQRDCWNQLFNLCAPSHPSRQHFYTLACELAGLATPDFTNGESHGKQIDGSKVSRMLGYEYRVADLLEWLRSLPPSARH